MSAAEDSRQSINTNPGAAAETKAPARLVSLGGGLDRTWQLEWGDRYWLLFFTGIMSPPSRAAEPKQRSKQVETGTLMDPNSESLTDLLAGYDREVDRTLGDVRKSRQGTERVQLLDKLRGLISVHDSMVESVLCPLLDDLPGGSMVAERFRHGCEERSALLIHFGHLTNGVPARNVYTTSGNVKEIEEIIDGLERSFRRHENDEPTGAVGVLEASSPSHAAGFMAARMAFGAQRAPSRGHKGTAKYPTSMIRRKLYHYLDKVHDWNDTHHGWIR